MSDVPADARTLPREMFREPGLCYGYGRSVTRCARCEGPVVGRADKVFCSDLCRVQAHRERERGDRDALVELSDVLGDALAEPMLVALVARAARSDWRAAIALLSARWPERWGAPELRTDVGDRVDDELLDPFRA